MTAFDAMHDVLFANANLALDAVYAAPATTPDADPNCRVMYWEVDRKIDLGVSGAVKPGPVAEMRASDVPLPVAGGTLAIRFGTGARNFEIKKVVADDSLRSIWRLALREV